MVTVASTGRGRGARPAPGSTERKDAKTGGHRRVSVDPSPPSATHALLAALDEAERNAAWLRKPDAAALAMLRFMLVQIDADPKLTPRLMPIAVSLATQLGLTPEARTRLALSLDDRTMRAQEPEETDHGAPAPVAFTQPAAAGRKRRTA